MFLWRISNYADLLGLGAMNASARWHTAGLPVVYLAENPSAALLEILVYIETDEDDQPDAYQLLKIEVGERVAYEEVDATILPAGWKNDEEASRAIGNDWLARGETALLRVPSAIAPETWNWLLNPRHAEAKHISVVHKERHSYDSRLL